MTVANMDQRLTTAEKIVGVTSPLSEEEKKWVRWKQFINKKFEKGRLDVLPLRIFFHVFSIFIPLKKL